MKNITVQLNESTVEQLDQVAETNGNSQSEYARNLVVSHV
ncbi:CopG family transcriptional regulator [Haladaptatus halobius]